jgi:tRNA threonylcarbamoyladenosine biosynthesis protein TsaE
VADLWASDSIVLADADATAALGARLAAHLAIGDCVALSGGLGAGKTTLARGLISAWMGRAEEAPSPTYTLAQLYEGPRGPLWHMDLYRLRSAEEADELGLEDALEEALCLIEWPERLAGRMPRCWLEISLALAPSGRVAHLQWQGRERPEWMAVVHG